MIIKVIAYFQYIIYLQSPKIEPALPAFLVWKTREGTTTFKIIRLPDQVFYNFNEVISLKQKMFPKCLLFTWIYIVCTRDGLLRTGTGPACSTLRAQQAQSTQAVSLSYSYRLLLFKHLVWDEKLLAPAITV